MRTLNKIIALLSLIAVILAFTLPSMAQTGMKVSPGPTKAPIVTTPATPPYGGPGGATIYPGLIPGGKGPGGATIVPPRAK